MSGNSSVKYRCKVDVSASAFYIANFNIMIYNVQSCLVFNVVVINFKKYQNLKVKIP